MLTRAHRRLSIGSVQVMRSDGCFNRCIMETTATMVYDATSYIYLAGSTTSEE